ncbi:MAG: hypothetical protein AB1752_00350 [Candidatus Zixiibacteriota bacterium]
MLQSALDQREKLLRLTVIAAGVMASRVVFYALTRFAADDAFITFRYAANLAAGNGFAYNAGEHVLGTTTPLFTLLLAAFAGLGGDPHTAALIVGCAASGLTAVVIAMYAESWGFGDFALLPVIVYALHPRTLAFDMAGMETALFTMLIVFGLYLHHRDRLIAAMVMAALAALTRPEGLLLLAILFAYGLRKKRESALRGLLAAICLIGPWVVFAKQYFGSPIPNSIPAKLALYAGLRDVSIWHSISFLLGLHNPLGIVLTGLAVGGGFWLHSTGRAGAVEAIWAAALILGLSLAPTRPFLWYPAAAYPILVMFACALAVAGLDRLKRHKAVPNAILRSAQVLVVTSLLLVNVRTVNGYRFEQSALEEVHRAIGLYLRENAAPADLVAAEDIGYLGYYSDCRILDRDGLVSPEAIAFNRSGDHLGMILKFNPAWVVVHAGGMNSDFIEDPEFLALYKEQTRFGMERGPTYLVFKRISEQPTDQFSLRPI